MRGSLNIRGSCAPVHGRAGGGSGRGRPLPVVGFRGYHSGKLFETETSVGAFLRIQKAILTVACLNFGLLLQYEILC